MSETLESLGPFFAVRVHRAGSRAVAPWSPMSELLHGDTLAIRVDKVRHALGGSRSGAVELRVAASVAHLGLVARIVAPALAHAALGLPEISLAPTDLHWQDHLGGPYPLSVASTGTPGPWPDSFIVTLTEAIAARFGVSRTVLEGNISSAANSAAQLLAAARPDRTSHAHAAADKLLAQPGVESGRSAPDFRRRSCCLIYRVSGGTTAVCGDCVLG